MSAAVTEAESTAPIPDARPIALWVVPVADLGGVARHVLDVFKTGMIKYRLVLLCPEGKLADRVRELGGSVVTAEFGPDFGFVRSVASLRQAAQRLNPRIVHTHLAYADVVAAAAFALEKSVKLISTEHGIAADDTVYHGSKLKSKVRATMHSVRLNRFDDLIAVSGATRDAMQNKWHPRQSITVIPNGVDRPRNGNREEAVRTKAGMHRVLSLSRLAPEKGLEELIEAFALLANDNPDVSLTIAGTGPLEAELKEKVKKHGLQDRISFPGFVDASDAIANHDVLVQLSVWENCSYTLLDALTENIGVVATPVGGNPELLSDDYLVNSSDIVEVANLIRSQLTGTHSSPSLSPTWPSVSEMADQIELRYTLLGEVKAL